MKSLGRHLLLFGLVCSIAACARGPVRDQRSVPDPDEYDGPRIEEPGVEQGATESEPYGPVPAPAPPATEEVGPPPPPAETAEAPPAEAEPDSTPPAPIVPKLCLVLGPGMAKAIAQAAVLEAIRKAALPVHCVVGTEMGAVVGALYAKANGSTNNLQWQLFKLNKDNYFNFPVISLREPKSNGKRLHEFLERVFPNRKLDELPIKFGTVANDLERGEPVEFDRGPVADALSATLALPGVFEPWRIGGVSYESAATTMPAPLELARKLGGTFLVLINVLEESGKVTTRFQKAFSSVRPLVRLQKKEASFVIDVPLANVGYESFDRQGEILAAGAKAAERAVPQLKAAWEKSLAAH